MTEQEMPSIDWEQAKSDMPEKLAYETCAQDQHQYEWIVPLGYLNDGDLVARCRKCGAELVAVRASDG